MIPSTIWKMLADQPASSLRARFGGEMPAGQFSLPRAFGSSVKSGDLFGVERGLAATRWDVDTWPSYHGMPQAGSYGPQRGPQRPLAQKGHPTRSRTQPCGTP